MEGLCSRQQETKNDRLCRRVHPAIPVARATEGVRPNPPFWIHGQLPAYGVAGSLPKVARDATGGSFYRDYFNTFHPLMPALRRPYDHRRAVEPSADSMEIPFKMFSRYLVAALHNGNFDVRSHVHAEVCSTTTILLKSTLDLNALAFPSHSRSTAFILSTQSRSSRDAHSVQRATRISHHSP